MASKALLLQKMDTGYLRDFLVSYNNTPRYECLSKSDAELIKHAGQKFSEAELNKIFSYYLLNKPAAEIADNLRQKSGKEITRLFISNLKPGEKIRTEFLANGRLCDIVLLDTEKSLVAVEVKANGDKIKSAISQCEDYKQWAEFVYLLIEEKKLSELEKIKLPNKVGLIVFDGKNFIKQIEAQKINQPVEKFITLLSTRSLPQILGELRLKKSGTKAELQKRLSDYAANSDISARIKASFFS